MAGLTSAADKLPYFTGSGTAALADFTSAARTVLDDTTVSAMVDTLGGTAATGTGAIVRASSPTLTTPNIGAATATSIAVDSIIPDAACNFDLNASNALGLQIRDSTTAMMLFNTSSDFIYASYPFQEKRRIVSYATSSVALAASDTGITANNTGAAGTVTFTLPTAVAGLHFRFCVTAAQAVRIQSNTAGQTIQFDDLNATSAHYFECASLVGGVLEVVCQDSTTWFVTNARRVWSLV